MCHLLLGSRGNNHSRVVGERRFQMLGQPLKVVPKLLEFAVGHRRLGRGTGDTRRKGRSRGRPWRPGGGDLLPSTYPQETYKGKKMSLTSSSTSVRRRRANARRNPLLIPAWPTSRACSPARVDRGAASRPERARKRQNR